MVNQEDMVFDRVCLISIIFCTIYKSCVKCNNPDANFISVTPHTRCRLKLLKLERVKDYLLMEEEFIKNQERLKPQEEKQEVGNCDRLCDEYYFLVLTYDMTELTYFSK